MRQIRSWEFVYEYEGIEQYLELEGGVITTELAEHVGRYLADTYKLQPTEILSAVTYWPESFNGYERP
jgi:hypothetical protein